MTKKIAVIDGNSLMHRAYHAVPPTMNAPDGTPTNAVFGFMSMLLKFIDMAQPDAIICAFDTGRPAFRMEVLEKYKSQRPPMDPDLKVQFPLMEDVLESMNIPVVKLSGWEGDDILGTVARRDEALGYETLLVTGDKDAYQLASDLTSIVTTKKGITDVAIYGPKEVLARYGVTPEQVPDFLGLKGDTSDNIPGVPGIGEKTAAKLLQEFDTLENLYENLDKLKGKQLEKLRDNKDAAFASREVATIVCDVDFPLDLEEVSFPSFDVDKVCEVFGSIRFNAHLNKVLGLIGKSPTENKADLEYEPVKKDSEALQLIEDALKDKERLGIAYVVNDQVSLFGSDLHIAFNSSKGTALLEGEEAKETFARVIREGCFASRDVKEMVQCIYPPDTKEPAYVEEKDLLSMNSFDLSLAAYALNSSLGGYSFDILLDQYVGGTLPETETSIEDVLLKACASRALVEPLQKALEDDECSDMYADVDLPLVAVLLIMERTGANIDVELLSRLGEETEEELDSLSSYIYDMAGEEFNIDSPKQLSHILFEVLGLNPVKKTKQGYSTDATVLKELSKVHDLPGLVIRYRELAKIKNTYIDALPRMRASDGRIHSCFNETVAATGRLSSSEPNLQNIPVRTDFGRQIRECFIPLNAGEKFMSADYSQIELRLLAHLSGDKDLLEAFTGGHDFHAQTASRVFNVPVDEVTPQLRSRAKAVNFGIVYGQQAFGLSQSLDIGFAEAKEMIDRYFEVYPGVRKYLDDTIQEAKDEGCVATLSGRKRHIPELKSTNAQQRSFGERTAMNHPMQGSAADVIKLAMIEVQRRMTEEGFKAKLLLQVHDELDFSVPDDEIEALSTMVKEVMENVVQLQIPLVVDVSWGDNWAVAH